jgi:hypothetical protein
MTDLDRYDGVPLGMEAFIPFLPAALKSERSDDEDRSAEGKVPSDSSGRG